MSQTSWYPPSVVTLQSVHTELSAPGRKESDELHPPDDGAAVIPPNPEGKRYSMRQIFQVWYDHQDEMVGSAAKTSKGREPFRAAKPAPIYHLALQHEVQAAAAADKSDAPASPLASSLASLAPMALLALDDHKTKPPPNLPPPTSLSAANDANELIQPAELQWVYLDPSGSEQGPFSGEVMQDWLSEGYLTVDLRIRRQDEPRYYTLSDLCERLQNFTHPFKVALPPVSERSDVDGNGSGNRNTGGNGNTGGGNENSGSGSAVSGNVTGGGSTVSGSTVSGASGVSASNGNPAPNSVPGAGNGAFSFSPLYSQLLPKGGLGAANVRPSSSQLFDFMSPDYLRTQQQFQAPYQAPFMDGGQNMPFGQLNMLSLLHQPMPPQLSRSSSGWGVEGLGNGLGGGVGVSPGIPGGVSSGMASGLSSQSLANQGIGNAGISAGMGSGMGSGMSSGMASGLPSGPLNVSGNMSMGMAQPIPGMMPQPMGQTPMSPWLSGVQSILRVSSPFAAPLLEQPHDMLDMHSSMVTGILGEGLGPRESAVGNADANEKKDGLEKAEVLEKKESLERTEKLEKSGKSEAFEKPKKSEKSEKSEKSAVSANSANHSVSSAAVSAAPVPVSAPVSTSTVPGSSAPHPDALSEYSKSPSDEKLHRLVEASQPVLAPWAASSVPNTPGPSFKEIQQLETERLQKEKQIKAELLQEQALLSSAAQKLDDRPEKLTFNWANTQQPVVAQKTLAEIQKEEADARARATRAAAASGGAAAAGSASRPSLASSLASTTPKDDFAWTTVASKKPAAKKGTVAASLSSPASTSLSPQMLRAASSAMSASSSLNSNALKEDFMVWARSAMTNLYPSVSKDDLLEVFATLPLHGDSAQLIAETVYSLSATMDGRRFAQEFMKRRTQVEKLLGGLVGLWSAAIAASADKIPAVDDEGWSTSVKLKKKGRKG